MSSSDWGRVKSILFRAMDLEPSERPSFLDRACGHDATLRREVEAYLEVERQEGSVLSRGLRPQATEPDETVTTWVASQQPSAPAGPEHVGPYRILERLGRGGMGEVYLGVRDDGQFERRVAIKVIRGLGSDESVLKRFHNERRYLAAIDHPNIARLLDGGSTEEGLPYFVMEYVEGMRIDDYCNSKRLDVGARIELFRDLCAAIQCAHQNLLVHRDIKPANVLVTSEGDVKLIDFGIAKLLNPEIAGGEAVHTRRDVRVLTPEYASPEQLRGGHITVTSDVYSLGLLLYELVTGRLPPRSAPYFSLVNEPFESLPPLIKPSELLRQEDSIAQKELDVLGQVSRPGLRRRLQGDIDHILMKALRPEPEKRYASANDLSDDLGRHLSGLPVRARRDTFWYRSSRFVRRNAAAVAAFGAFAAAALGFAGVALVQQRRLADEGEKSRLVLDYLGDSMRSHWELASTSRESSLASGSFLDAAGRDVERKFHGRPDVEASVRHILGVSYLAAGRYVEGEFQLRKALALRRRLGAEAEIVESLSALAQLHLARGEAGEAVPLLREAHDARVRRLGREHPETTKGMNDLGVALRETEDFAEAESFLREALVLNRSLPNADAAEIATNLANLGTLHLMAGSHHEAEEALRESLALQLAGTEKSNAVAGRTLNNLGLALLHQGRLEQSRDTLERALEVLVETVGPDNWMVGRTLSHLGDVLTRLEDYDSAQERLQAARVVLLASLGPDDALAAEAARRLERIRELREQNGNRP